MTQFVGGKGATGVKRFISQAENRSQSVGLAVQTGIDLGQRDGPGWQAPTQTQQVLKRGAGGGE